MDRREKTGKWIADHFLFILFFVMMAVYYAYHLYALKPWYDELYTYYYFISRGPLYAAIHWPVPNNHVGYSVISACFDFFGNSYIGLRGLSYLSALANLWLLYNFAKRFWNCYLAAGAVFLYASFYLVNSLAIQGRGYTFATTCFLLALQCLYRIVADDGKRLDYILYAVSLIMGIYTLPSSVYWVVPLCITGGIFLLCMKEYRKLWKLIVVSLIAAAASFFLYALIWLAIGANLLSKDPAGIYYDMYQVNIILKAPFQALKTGIDYMLATPYIQSIERGRALHELFSYFSMLFNQFYENMGVFITIFLAAGWGIVSLYVAYQSIRRKHHSFMGICLCIFLLMLPVMLLLQSVQPYKRVFSYFGVILSLLVIFLISLTGNTIKNNHLRKKTAFFLSLFFFANAVFWLTKPGYRMQYADRENQIARILSQDVEQIDTMFYMDDYQKYVIKFYFDKEPVETSLEQADYVLLPKELLQADYEVPQWPILLPYEEHTIKYLTEYFEVIREEDGYILYRRSS